MDSIAGAVEDLTTSEHLVNIRLTLTGSSGTRRLDYRTDSAVQASVGNRMLLRFKEPPVLEIVTATSSDISYNIRAVHYKRLSTSVPVDTASIAAIPGSVEIIRSQLQNVNRVTIGTTPAVTNTIKPDPHVGYSPCLDVAYSSLGTNADSRVELIIHCVILASGSDLPEYS